MKTKSYARRDFLRMAGLSAALPLATHLTIPGRSESSSLRKRPNIVFILTDDQRYDAMSCAGHPWL
ncbi:MAG: hypothetical protein ACYTEK_16295, partial [Planctomycetota bacterium]